MIRIFIIASRADGSLPRGRIVDDVAVDKHTRKERFQWYLEGSFRHATEAADSISSIGQRYVLSRIEVRGDLGVSREQVEGVARFVRKHYPKKLPVLVVDPDISPAGMVGERPGAQGITWL